MKKPLIILTGPTAVGKTKISIKLAKKLNSEIISADSMQVYKYMDIGTAKIKQEEMEGIPHYLIDEIEPNKEFNIQIFQTMAKQYINNIYSKNKIPLIVGGTGFYIQSIIYDIDFAKNKLNNNYRSKLEKISIEKGNDYLHSILKKIDRNSANNIHPNNVKRVIRAIEFYFQTKETLSKHNEQQKKNVSPYNFVYFVLSMDRNLLYERINNRVELMIREGLIEEVEKLKAMGYNKKMISMQGLGYKEIFDYLDGIYTKEEVISIIKRDTRHFAKRQLTWFRREKNVHWIDITNNNNDTELLTNLLKVVEQLQII